MPRPQRFSDADPESPVPPGVDRRRFLKNAVAVTGGLTAAAWSPAWAGSPNDRLGVAVVGTGNMGGGHLRWLAQQPDVRLVALCDVDATRLDAAATEHAPDAVRAKDYREAVGRDDVDVVFVATPDHWHGLIAVEAARAGKHVYCEKPLANSVGEGRAIADAGRAAGVVIQTGSHERSNRGAEVARQVVADGRLGEVHTVRIHLPNSDRHLQEVENFSSPPPNTEPPAGLDYDFWLGHTPKVAYNEKRCHFFWRFHSAYGGGEMTDRGAHVIDLAHLILGLDRTGPVRVEASGTPPAGGFYDTYINFRFETRYANGLRMIGDNSGARGLTLQGSEGELFVKVHGCALTATPGSLLDGYDLRPRGNPYDLHRRSFLGATRGGPAVAASAEAGHRTASACHLNNLAIRTGRGFDWDPAAERSSEEAVNALLTPPMRAPWSLG